MSKLIRWQDLRHHMKCKGFFLLFYNGKCEGYNKELVAYMNKLAAHYRLLDIFEIDLIKTKELPIDVKNDMMNKVHLYNNGGLIFEENYPNEEELNGIFKKVVNIYNTKIENKANNIGSKKFGSVSSSSVTKHKQISHYQKKQMERQKRFILRKRIEFKYFKFSYIPIIKNISIVENIELTKFGEEINKESNVLQCENFLENIKSHEITKMNYESPNKWFSDVKFTDLPLDIVQQPPILNKSKNSKIQNKYSRRITLSSDRTSRLKSIRNPDAFSLLKTINSCTTSKRSQNR